MSMENERRRRNIVDRAVEAADRIIMDGSDGSNEETDLLTAEVAKEFLEKVHGRLQSALLAKEIAKEHDL